MRLAFDWGRLEYRQWLAAKEYVSKEAWECCNSEDSEVPIRVRTRITDYIARCFE